MSPPFTYDIDEVSFSVPTNYTFGQGYDDTALSIKIQVKLGTGNIIESSFRRLAIPETAIKTNLRSDIASCINFLQHISIRTI